MVISSHKTGLLLGKGDSDQILNTSIYVAKCSESLNLVYKKKKKKKLM